jgi:diguanylate cyclase (GGDEF)-like protein
VSAPLPDVAGATDFGEAARRVLDYLRATLPLTFWSVTRVENGRQTYLYLDEDNGYGLREGGSHPWEASFCIHMASGAAPAIAPDAQAVPLYAQAGVNDSVTIGTYAGAPVREADGSLFGAICGLDREARTGDEALAAAGPVLALLGQLLTLALAVDRSREAARRLTEEARAEADTDVLTSLLNRRGWDRCVEREQLLMRRFGDPTVVAVVDLDGLKDVNDTQGHAAGDELIRQASRALVAAVREGDTVARLGGDEFGVLLRGCDERSGAEITRRMRDRLARAEVAASVGWQPVAVVDGLAAALDAADAAMYADKRARRERHLHLAG